MKLNLTHEDIDRLRGHARDGGAIKGEDLLNLLQDWVTLERALAHLEKALCVDRPKCEDMEGMPWEGRK